MSQIVAGCFGGSNVVIEIAIMVALQRQLLFQLLVAFGMSMDIAIR